MVSADARYAYESALCHELMFADHGDAEERLATVLAVLAKVAQDAGLENVAFFAEQSIIELTRLDL